jgi:hypothetical protein
MLEDALLVQLPAFSVEQVASALASLQHFTPSDTARAALLTAVAEHSSSQVRRISCWLTVRRVKRHAP